MPSPTQGPWPSRPAESRGRRFRLPLRPKKVAEQHPNEMVLATTAATVRAAHKAGKIAALMGMEGGHSIDNSLGVLREMARFWVEVRLHR